MGTTFPWGIYCRMAAADMPLRLFSPDRAVIVSYHEKNGAARNFSVVRHIEYQVYNRRGDIPWRKKNSGMWMT